MPRALCEEVYLSSRRAIPLLYLSSTSPPSTLHLRQGEELGLKSNMGQEDESILLPHGVLGLILP